MGNLARGPTEGLYMAYPYAEPGLEREREYTLPRPEHVHPRPGDSAPAHPSARISAEPLEAVMAAGADHEPSSRDRSLMILADSRRQALARAEVAEERTQVLERRELKLAKVLGALLLTVGAASVAALDFGLRSGRLEEQATALRDEFSTVQGQLFEVRAQAQAQAQAQVSEAALALRGAEFDHRERVADLNAALTSERERRMRAEAAWAARVVQQLFLRP